MVFYVTRGHSLTNTNERALPLPCQRFITPLAQVTSAHSSPGSQRIPEHKLRGNKFSGKAAPFSAMKKVALGQSPLTPRLDYMFSMGSTYKYRGAWAGEGEK